MTRVPGEVLEGFMMGLLKVCLHLKIRQFDKMICDLKDGVPTGTSLVLLMADLFVDHFEKQIFNSASDLISHIGYLHRYS